eukprot:1161048-Pelagomonas_calceolata.AAC.2
MQSAFKELGLKNSRLGRMSLINHVMNPTFDHQTTYPVTHCTELGKSICSVIWESSTSGKLQQLLWAAKQQAQARAQSVHNKEPTRLSVKAKS